MRFALTALAVLAVPLSVACAVSAEPAPGPGAPPPPATRAPATEPIHPPAGTASAAKSDPPRTSAEIDIAAVKDDLADVSAAAICAARAEAKPLGSYKADATWGIDDAIDVSAGVSAVRTQAGQFFNSVDQQFVYPSTSAPGANGAPSRSVAMGLWIVNVKAAPKENTDAIVTGATVDVEVIAMGKLATRCSRSESTGGAFSHEGPGDPGKLVVTTRTDKLLEGRIERHLPDGSITNLAFRAPLAEPAAPGGIDTVCCSTP